MSSPAPQAVQTLAELFGSLHLLMAMVHDPASEQQKALNVTLRGHYQYYGRSSNYRAIRQFYARVLRIWREWLSRRTRAKPLQQAEFIAIVDH